MDHLVVNDYEVKLIYGCMNTILNNYLQKGEEILGRCSQHLDLFQLFEHGKGNLINCMAQTLIRMINAIVGPTKMHFGERYPIHHIPHLMQNLSGSYF